MSFKKIITPSLLVLGLAAGLTACGSKDETKTAVEQTIKTAELGAFGIATEYMDLSVKPGDDFFRYVNGGWLEKTEIPADKSNYGSFGMLADRSTDQVKAIIEDLAKQDNQAGSVEQKIGDLYAAFMDTDTIEAKGMAPAQADLAAIEKLSSHTEAAAMMGDPSMGLSSPVGGWVTTDAKNPDAYIFYITQSGLGMPNRSYYFDEGKKADDIRAAYLVFLTTMLEAAGKDEAATRAVDIMALETKMAEQHWELAKRRNRDLTYNKMSMDELIAYAPGFDWQAMANAGGIGEQKHFVVRENDAIQGLAATFADTPLSVLKDYMAAHYISANSAYLPSAIDKADFAFYSTALRGTKEQRPRWKRGVGVVNNNLGEAIGQVYVKHHFPPASKKQMDELVENLRDTFEEGIDDLEWMGDDTKKQAQYKLAKFYSKIGYPKNWKDYSTFTVDKDDLIGTVKSANAWGWHDMVSKLGQPIDREEWGMYPQTVNAYYNPGLNEIVFPAAILQAPFFDPNADPAVNYGGIGAVIGHEMGHGFDDQGSKSDGDGKQRDWWTAEDKSAFTVKTEVLVGQYNEFSPLEGEHVDGELTLGENIGDLTGLTMSYAAYQRSLGGKEAPVIGGFTGDQRFFLSYGQIWQRKFREEEMRNRLKTDTHSPAEYRANGALRNFGPWYEAFDIQPSDALYLAPEDRVKIW